MTHTNSAPRQSRTTRVAIVIVAAIVLTILTSIALVSLTYHTLVLGGRWALTSEWLRGADPQARSAALGQLGDYFGGTLNPILSFSGFLVLLVTVVLQRRQLKEGTQQLAQSTRAIDLEAFVRVNDMLQTPEGIAARARLLDPRQGGDVHARALDQWSTEDRGAAETVCRQFELVAVLIEGRLFDPDLFLRSWHHSVAHCWQSCEAFVHERRQQLGDPGYCRHFEELDALARSRAVQAVPRRLGHATKAWIGDARGP